MKDRFVLSSSEFDGVKSAEKVVSGWYKSGSLKNLDVKLYKVVEVYDLKLKFVKRKNVQSKS